MTRDDLLLLMYQQGIGTGYVVDCDTYELKMANPPMLKEIGHPFEAWRGKVCYEFIYGKKEPCHFCKMHKMCPTETVRWHHKSSLNQQEMLVHNYKIVQENETLFCQLSYPIPKEMEELEALSARMTAVQLLTACGKNLLAEEQSVVAILRELCHFYGGSCGYLYMKEKNATEFSVHSTYFEVGAEKNQKQPLTQTFLLMEEEVWKHHFEKKDYFFLEDSAPLHKVLGENHILTERFHKNILIAPLLSDGDFQGVLVVENLGENFQELHLVSTILGFLNNHFFMNRHVEQLEVEKRTCETVLACVKTLASEDVFTDATHKLLDYLLEYFQAERGFLIQNKGGQLEISVGNQKKLSNSDEKLRLEENSLEVLTAFFDQYGEGDLLFLDSILDKVEDIASVKKVLEEDGVENLLGIRLYNEEEVSYFLLIENPSNLENRDVILKSVRNFVYNYLVKDNLQKKLEQLSYSDGLTGLYNRNYFQRFVEDWKKRGDERVGIVFADVNGLKKVNDNFGHEAGDVLIKWAGLFLEKNMLSEKKSLVFRLAGDEFVCVLPRITESCFQEIQTKILENMNKQGEKHISFGCFWTEGSTNLEEAVKTADGDMYFHKQEFYKEQARDERTVQQSLDDLKVELARLNQVILKECGKKCQP